MDPIMDPDMDPIMDPDAPTPESRALPGCNGTPVTLGDGAEWLLHPGGLLNELDDVRDRIDDSARLSGSASMGDILTAGFRLLMANYDLAGHEAAALLAGAEKGVLASAVSEALFGPEEGGRRTFTSWAASALIANGIDPASVPTRLLNQVLDHLVASGRAIPLEKSVESAVAARKFAGLRSMIRKPEPTAPTEAAP